MTRCSPSASARWSARAGSAIAEPDDDPLDRRWAVGLGIAAVLVVAAFVLAAVVGGGGDVEAPVASPTTRDLSTVTNEELERVVAENPDVVPMRLRLVERLLNEAGEVASHGDDDAGTERDALFERARVHAEQAERRATTLDDKARALRYLGWTTALLGEPEQGEVLVIQSLGIDDANPDALYFLAYIRFVLLGDAAAALPALEELESRELSDQQRVLIEGLLADVRLALGLAATTTSIVQPAGG